MMLTKKALVGSLITVASVLTSTFAAAQKAQQPGWYVGGSFGQSQVDVDCGGTTSCDDSDTSWKIFGGYRINQNFAVEFGYADLGEVTASTPAFVDPFLGPIPAANVSIESSVFELVGVGSFPLANRFSLFGKVGLYRSDTDVEVRFSGLGSVSESEDNLGLTFGVGASFDVTRNLAVRAEWQRYSDVDAGDFGESDVDVFAVGVIWKF